MTIYRWIKDGKLYILYQVNGGYYKFTGSWHTALPYKHNGSPISHCNMNEFIPIADSGRVQ